MAWVEEEVEMGVQRGEERGRMRGMEELVRGDGEWGNRLGEVLAGGKDLG